MSPGWILFLVLPPQNHVELLDKDVDIDPLKIRA